MTIDEYENHINADENAKIANAGIIIVGKGDKVRALMAYGGGPKGCVGYAQAANKYKEVFGDKVNIYCMVIPTAVEFYCPDKVKKRTNQQLPTIRNVVAHLNPGVKPVDVYTTLGKHANEDIYLRTDHHWSPLGGYYAAQEFARVAGVPFKDLSLRAPCGTWLCGQYVWLFERYIREECPRGLCLLRSQRCGIHDHLYQLHHQQELSSDWRGETLYRSFLFQV